MVQVTRENKQGISSPESNVRIHYEPWVGKNYFTKGYKGKRILVLGESHYCTKELSEGGRCFPQCKEENMFTECVSQTQDVVREAVYDYRGRPYQQTFLCFERAMAGKELTLPEREELWEGMMFYNYIQFAQSGPRKAPRPEHWIYSEKAFGHLLSVYKPDYIIVWGVRLYGNIPQWGAKECKLTLENGDTADYRVYSLLGKDIRALKIHHPSSPTGKNWEYWHEIIERFLYI